MTFIVIFLMILTSIIDVSVASLVISIGMYIIGVIQILCQKENRRVSLRLYNIVFSVYLVCAFIVSFSFSDNNYYLVSDPSRYIESYINSASFFFSEEDFVNCYMEFSDSNTLYNAYINAMSMLANKTFGGMTVFGLTLCQTIWGILSSLILFRILIRRFDADKSYCLTLVFIFCSLFLFYSTVIIRDIIICYLYLVAFDVIDQKFKLSGVIKLLLIIVFAWGIRLYSGLFAISFLAYYFYVQMRNSYFRKLATVLFVVGLVVIAGSVISLSIMEQTLSELDTYTELTTDQSEGGVVSKLQLLPPGISNFAIVLFTMIRPLPPFGIYSEVETFSHFILSTMQFIAGFFWFVVFYSLCYLLSFKRYISKIPFEKVVLLLVCLIFLLANASHPDIRRMLPVYPILFVQYVEICTFEKVTLFGSGISKSLISFFIMMAIGMLIIM